MNSIQFVAETPSGVGFNEHSNTALRRGLVTYSDFRQTQIRRPQTRASRGGIDEINPEDIVYGEYSCDAPDNSDEYIDLIYLDGDILRTFSGYIKQTHPVVEELKVILRDDKKFYLVVVKEVARGFAFKRTDISDIKVTSLIQGNRNHEPSCTWNIKFKDKSERGVEVNYQSYFAYGNTMRPRNMTNQYILDRTFSK